MKQYLLGIDVGTTGTKTLLFSADGELLGHAYRPYALHTPQVGYSEQNAEDWWNAVCETVREVCADPEIGKAVAAISLSLQGGTMVAVDKDMQPVRPAMVWNDGRGGPQMEEYLREVGEADRCTKGPAGGWENPCLWLRAAGCGTMSRSFSKRPLCSCPCRTTSL